MANLRNAEGIIFLWVTLQTKGTEINQKGRGLSWDNERVATWDIVAEEYSWKWPFVKNTSREGTETRTIRQGPTERKKLIQLRDPCSDADGTTRAQAEVLLFTLENVYKNKRSPERWLINQVGHRRYNEWATFHLHKANKKKQTSKQVEEVLKTSSIMFQSGREDLSWRICLAGFAELVVRVIAPAQRRDWCRADKWVEVNPGIAHSPGAAGENTT